MQALEEHLLVLNSLLEVYVGFLIEAVLVSDYLSVYLTYIT